MTDFRRRTALGMLGASMAFLAGCSDTSDGTDDGNGTDGGDDASGSDSSLEGDLPSYASILPTTDGSSYFYGAIGVETMYTLLQDEGAESGQEPTDPLVGNPVVVALLAAFGLRLLGSSAGFDAYNGNNETADGEEQFVYADGVYALVGSYDRDALAADLEDAGYTLESEGDAYAVYADDGSDEIVGVTDNVFAYSYPNGSDSSFDPVAAVERTVATAAGDRQPKHEADDDFERLLRAGKNGGIACCLYTANEQFASETLSNDQASDSEGLQFAFGAFEGARGVHQHLGVSGGTATAQAVVTYNTADLVDRARLKSSLGGDADADTVAFARDGSTISVDAKYGGSFATE
ncbi:hypothetical protein [Natrinema sp. 74]|uniref:hypothetical protein n=1 Tax=Natrinema sp. 74 TaxID=3384159 RepID=UPI0038D3836D